MKKDNAKKAEPVLCAKCGAGLSPAETRVYLEGIFHIDPNWDDRRLCNKCKKEENESRA